MEFYDDGRTKDSLVFCFFGGVSSSNKKSRVRLGQVGSVRSGRVKIGHVRSVDSSDCFIVLC